MSRAKRGLPLLFDHDQRDAIGAINSITLDKDRKLRGVLKFSRSARGEEMLQNVLDGILKDISIGYRINKTETDERTETVRATNWTPYEGSLVTVPADDSVGINRSHQGDHPMDTDGNIGDGGGTPTPDLYSIQELDIRRGFEPFMTRAGVAELQARVLRESLSTTDAMAELLAHIGGAGAPEPGPVADVVPGEDASDKFARAAEDAIMIRAGLATDEEVTAGHDNPYRGHTLAELARSHLALHQVDTAGKSPQDVIGICMARAIDPGTANLDTTDFTEILENVMNKGLFRGFDEAVRTWDQWCSTNSVSDFKAYTRPGLSQFTSLALVAENGAIADGIMVDKKEGGALATFARKLSLTREAMVNDDLAAFAGNAQKMGEAAQRTIDEQVYTLLESNPVMTEDATALFDNLGHGNNPVAGAPPTEALITDAKVAMAAQVDQNSILLDLRPRIMLVPIALEETAIKLATAEFSPDGAANPFEPNSVRNTFVPVASGRLTSAVAWFMLGTRGQTCEVNFLNGQRNPSLERDEGWSTLAMHWRVWIDFDPLFVDWRAAFKNNGV